MSLELAALKNVLELEVFRGQARVGVLSRTKWGSRFVYDRLDSGGHPADAPRAVAFSMPVREAPYEVRGVNLHPFFAGLLPEGLRLRALARGVKTSEDDLFSLLVAAGGDAVGDVWVQVPGVDSTRTEPMLDTTHLAESSFKELLDASLGLGERADRVTVAGIQPKVSAARISIPLRARSRRYDSILKLSPPEYPKLVENEAFFMQLARSMRLDTAAVRLVHDRDGAAGLLVERFDRVQQGADKQTPLLRLHQEDACQLLDRYPADKYRISLREVAEALEVCSAPVAERLRLLQLQALSYVIGNGDLHGKNLSLQVVEGRVRLTPIYDLLSTLPYGDESLALELEGRDKRLRAEDFIAFGERIGLRSAATRRMLDTLIKGVGPYVEHLNEIGLSERKTRHMQRVIAERLGMLGA